MFSVVFALIGSFTGYYNYQMGFFYNNAVEKSLESSNTISAVSDQPGSYMICDDFGIDVFTINVGNNNVTSYGFVNRAIISKHYKVTIQNFVDIKETKISYTNFYLNLTTRGLEYSYNCSYEFIYSNNNSTVRSFTNTGLYTFPNYTPGIGETGYITANGYFNYRSAMKSHYYDKGYKEGNANTYKIQNLIASVLKPIDDFLQIEIYPGVKLWYFVAVPLFFSLLQFFLNLWR